MHTLAATPPPHSVPTAGAPPARFASRLARKALDMATSAAHDSTISPEARNVIEATVDVEPRGVSVHGVRHTASGLLAGSRPAGGPPGSVTEHARRIEGQRVELGAVVVVQDDGPVRADGQNYLGVEEPSRADAVEEQLR